MLEGLLPLPEFDNSALEQLDKTKRISDNRSRMIYPTNRPLFGRHVKLSSHSLLPYLLRPAVHLALIAAGFAAAWLAYDWQQNYPYKNFGRYLIDEVRWLQTWKVERPVAVP